MKKMFYSVCCVVLCCFLLLGNTVSAATVILTGNDANLAEQNITIGLYSATADVNHLKPTDILYLNQMKADENGQWELRVPLDIANLEEIMVVSNQVSSLNVSDGKEPVYLSATGDDTADGKTLATAVKSLEKALKLVENGTIYLSGTVKLPSDFIWEASDKSITVCGTDSLAVLDISDVSSFSIGCDTVFENLAFNLSDAGNGNASNTIFAEGNHVVIKDSVTTNLYAQIYAGSQSRTIDSTHLEVYGGSYLKIFATSLNHPVLGDCKLVVGGKTNQNHVIKEFTSEVPTVYCGGWNCAVGGDCVVTLKDDIKFTEVYGGSQGGKGAIAGTNILNIMGGEYMNVHGCYSNMENAKSNTVFTMTGGTAEAVFGGGKSMIYGDISMYLLGGTITRRVYGGCYNNYTGSWKSDYYVKGNIGIAIGADINLPLDYDINRGIFGGSRTKTNHTDEISALVFMDGTYTALQNKIGDISGWGSTLKSHHDYVVTSSLHGKVDFAFDKGNNTIQPIPEDDYKTQIEEKDFTGNYHTLVSVMTNISFTKTATIKNVDLNYSNQQADVTIDASFPETSCTMIVAIYDGNKLVGTSAGIAENSKLDDDILIDCSLESNKTYTVKAFIWQDMKQLTPACTFYIRTFTHF